MTRERYHAHPIERPSRVREAVDVAMFFVAVIFIVLILSVDGVH